MEVLEESETAGILTLLKFGLNLTMNSAARCSASAADPPLPHKIILPPL